MYIYYHLIFNLYNNFYVAKKPPSIGKVTPFIIVDLSLNKYKTALTTSETSPNL